MSRRLCETWESPATSSLMEQRTPSSAECTDAAFAFSLYTQRPARVIIYSKPRVGTLDT